MAILSNSICTSVPEADFSKKLVTSGIVGKRKCDVDKARHVGVVHSGMKIIAYSCKYG